jgi:hypothetical protein
MNPTVRTLNWSVEIDLDEVELEEAPQNYIDDATVSGSFRMSSPCVSGTVRHGHAAVFGRSAGAR